MQFSVPRMRKCAEAIWSQELGLFNVDIDKTAYEFIWKLPAIAWLMVAGTSLLVGFVFLDALADLLKNWARDEYGHGYFIPIICLFLIWQQKDQLEKMSFDGAWSGVILLCLGLIFYSIGTLGAVIDIVTYGLVLVIFGLFLSLTGTGPFRLIVIPLALLWFMIPLPSFIYSGLSGELQLISSKIGVALIRLFDISVYLEGNVFDLGVYKIQVIEACNGLRYLFPLMTLGFIAAYFFKVELWKRVLVFLSTIPITILMNSIRIGAVGITVEYWGVKMADGVLHEFEGWVIFMGCMAMLVIEMMVLVRIGQDKRPLRQVFGFEVPMPTPKSTPRKLRHLPKSFIASIAILVMTSIALLGMPERTDIIPERNKFTEFPRNIGGWHAKVGRLGQIVIDTLRFDDYLLVDYYKSDQIEPVNLYAGYYNIQRASKVPHSPKVCIPGGGWRISSLTQRQLDGITISGTPLTINRLIIVKGEERQLVYYWFQQRDRIITNEYLVKWYLLIDAIKKRRTDGALVRFTVMLKPETNLNDAEKRMETFIAQVTPMIPEYIPK